MLTLWTTATTPKTGRSSLRSAYISLAGVSYGHKDCSRLGYGHFGWSWIEDDTVFLKTPLVHVDHVTRGDEGQRRDLTFDRLVISCSHN